MVCFSEPTQKRVFALTRASMTGHLSKSTQNLKPVGRPRNKSAALGEMTRNGALAKDNFGSDNNVN